MQHFGAENSLHSFPMTAPAIVYEDDVLLVCNKPAGLMVEPDRNNFPNLLQHVKHYLQQKSGEKMPYVQHLHRLDRPTSGLVLFTKQKEHLRNLSEQFAQRTIEKHYEALSATAPSQMEALLEQWHRKEKKKAVLVPEGTPFAEKACLDYRVEPTGPPYRWHIHLHTGKYHQIRVQLSALGCPILGDTVYGSHTAYLPDAIALHARKLSIVHPVSGSRLHFEAAAPF